MIAYDTNTVFAILPINFLTGLVIPYTRALLSNNVLPEAQAQMFAGLAGIESIGTLLSPLFSLGYSFTVKTYDEAMFLVMSSLTAVSALIILSIRSRNLIKPEHEGYTSLDDNVSVPIIEEESNSVHATPDHSIPANTAYGGENSFIVTMVF